MLISKFQVQSAMEGMVGIKRTNIASAIIIERQIRSLFGLDAKTVALVWNMMFTKNLIEKKARLKYLLITIAFFKTYSTYDQVCQRFLISYPTLNYWIWYFALHIANLDVVSLKNNCLSIVSILKLNLYYLR